jgi:hypothetical protein
VAAEFAALARARFRGVHADILDNDGIDGMSSGRLRLPIKSVTSAAKAEFKSVLYRSAEALRHPKQQAKSCRDHRQLPSFIRLGRPWAAVPTLIILFDHFAVETGRVFEGFIAGEHQRGSGFSV